MATKSQKGAHSFDIPLTAKEELFARYYVATGSQIDAYKLAYDSDLERTGNASRIRHAPQVAARIAELLADAAKTEMVSREGIIAWLYTLASKAEEVGQFAAANKAVELLGRTMGLYVDVQKSETEQVSPADVRRRIAELHAANPGLIALAGGLKTGTEGN